MWSMFLSIMLTLVYLANKVGPWFGDKPLPESTEMWLLSIVTISWIAAVVVLDIRSTITDIFGKPNRDNSTVMVKHRRRIIK